MGLFLDDTEQRTQSGNPSLLHRELPRKLARSRLRSRKDRSVLAARYGCRSRYHQISLNAATRIAMGATVTRPTKRATRTRRRRGVTSIRRSERPETRTRVG